MDRLDKFKKKLEGMNVKELEKMKYIGISGLIFFMVVLFIINRVKLANAPQDYNSTNIQYKDTNTSTEVEKSPNNVESDEMSSEVAYARYVEEMEKYNFAISASIANSRSEEEFKSLYQDSAMLSYFSQLKEEGAERDIVDRLRKGAIKEPINFFVSALFVNSYERTPLIYKMDSLNPEFDELKDLDIQEIEKLDYIPEAEKTYLATFTLDNYKMQAVFFKVDSSYSIYKIEYREAIRDITPPFLTVEEFEAIRGPYIE